GGAAGPCRDAQNTTASGEEIGTACRCALTREHRPMTAADYVDWCDYAGLYLGNVSRAERYRTYQPKIGKAGLVTVIVHDFLRHNDGGIDVGRWRSSDVYEIGADATFRVEQTALAL